MEHEPTHSLHQRRRSSPGTTAAEQGTVWLSQLEMAELFNASKQNISLHLKNIFEDGVLAPAATVKESLTVQTEGGREVRRSVTLYNLEQMGSEQMGSGLTC